MKSNPLFNPQLIAGLKMMGNHMAADPLIEAVKMQREQLLAQSQAALHDAQVQEKAREALIGPAVANILRGLDLSKPQESMQKLVSAGMDPANAALVLQRMTPEAAVVADSLGGYHKVDKRLFGNEAVSGGGAIGGNAMANPSPVSNSSNPVANTVYGNKAKYDAEVEVQKKRALSNDEFINKLSTERISTDKALSRISLIEKQLPRFYQGFGSTVQHTALKPFLDDKENRAYELFKNQANKIVLETAQDQSGAQSDSDMRRIELSEANETNSELGNKNIIDAAKAMLLRKSEFIKAAKEYDKEAKKRPEIGDIHTFTERWHDYTEAFPILDEDEEGNLIINQNNIKNWKSFIFEPEFEQVISPFISPTEINPAVLPVNGSKIKASNGKTYTKQQLEEMKRIYGKK